MKKKGLTEVVFILDKSGSMFGLEADTIGGFNSFINKQKEIEGECLVTTVLFNQGIHIVHDRVDISKIKPMTEKDYVVGGGTALLDAVGRTVNHIGKLHKYHGHGPVPEKTVFVITTDGLENSSHYYNYEKIKMMIERQKERFGWEFLFLGANMDAISEAGKLGIDAERAVAYHCDAIGTAMNFEAVSGAVENVRMKRAFSSEWKAEIENRKR